MPGYLTKLECVPVEGVADLLIRSLLDRQQFADPLGEAERLGISSAAWPLFGLLWPSGSQLAAQLAAHPVNAGLRVLEIGCGLALASLTGHRIGHDMTASDCHPLAQRFLEANLTLNALPRMKYRHGQWGASAGDETEPDTAHRVRVRGRYDLVIGSDLLYERDADATLAAFIARHVTEAGEIWIVDPDRGNRPAFHRQMAAEGFSMREEKLDQRATAIHAAYTGRLLVYRHA
ncbi:MAG: SAM-dependent methyltransferase [Pseudomonadota bacterium]